MTAVAPPTLTLSMPRPAWPCRARSRLRFLQRFSAADALIDAGVVSANQQRVMLPAIRGSRRFGQTGDELQFLPAARCRRFWSLFVVDSSEVGFIVFSTFLCYKLRVSLGSPQSRRHLPAGDGVAAYKEPRDMRLQKEAGSPAKADLGRRRQQADDPQCHHYQPGTSS